eukprot:TRINITY_DN8752_c0_g1_i3.p2 TRINITY_DN8752_c0_g1~~TRINITY_DN8752_c0_g1_i3.p2  ORF type:complete len:182 (-),score=18.43 TRINITY_DN8752_c0_g1_i3:148-693(-)
MKEGSFLKVKKNPGPGTYEHKSGLIDISYSMRPKTSNPQDNTSNKKAPGPGTYNHIQTINQSGKYSISKYQCYGVTAFNPPSSAKYSESNKDLKKFPGPGTYENKFGLSESGKYFFSKFQASGCRIFPRYKRLYFGDKKDNYPGPGTYEANSEFGHYDQPEGMGVSFAGKGSKNVSQIQNK